MAKSRARKFAELLDGSDNVKSARLGNATSTVDGATDTNLASVADNDLLAYDSTSGKWTNQSASEAGIVSEVVGDTSPQLGGDLDTNGNDVNFGDSDKAQFGAGNDLQIYHDGSNSYVHENGTGSLNILATDQIKIGNSANNEVYAKFNSNGNVELRHDNSVKLETTSNGIDVSRPASDGTIQSWKRGTTEVAKLSVGSTDNIEFSAMQGGGSGLQFWGGGGTDPVISPMKQGVSSDNTVELGRANARFKKFHFTEWGTAPSGTILQVKSYNYSSITTSSFSNSGASNTPLYVDITPKKSNSRMFITVHIFGEFGDTGATYNTPVALLRGSTLLKNSNGTASGISSFTQSYFAADDDSTPEVCSFQYWDAPATTNSVRYRVTLGPNNNTGTRYFYFNRTVGSSTGLGYERGISNITVMEVAQ